MALRFRLQVAARTTRFARPSCATDYLSDIVGSLTIHPRSLEMPPCSRRWFRAPALEASSGSDTAPTSKKLESFSIFWNQGNLWLRPAEPHEAHARMIEDDSLMSDAEEEGLRLHLSWLRDNCRCSKCVNQDTMQRNFDTFGLGPLQIENVTQDENGLQVSWEDEHVSYHPWSWLNASLPPERRTSRIHRQIKRDVRLWNCESATTAPESSYNDVMEGTLGMGKLMSTLMEYGFCFVNDTPKTPEATKELLERIGPIRHTHYGGFYDFTPDLAKADTAYTNIALAAHTDTTYFSEPAGLQAFHLLSHTNAEPDASEESGVSGGESLLVDGFHAADIMEAEFPTHFKKLTQACIPWHASGNDGIAITPDQNYPVVECDEYGQRRRIRWNNDDRGVLSLRQSKWYNAARRWKSILERPENQYWFQLKPGRMLIFDNWRVLHGRSAFNGIRRMCGAYIGRDDFVSRWKTTNFPKEDVLRHNLNRRRLQI